MAMTVKEVDEMSTVAEENCVVLMTAENYLFDPGVQLIMRFIDDGLLGKLQSIELEEIGYWNMPDSNSYLGHTWRSTSEMAGGGVLLDSGVHLTALAARFGGDVVGVTGKMATFYRVLNGKENRR